MTDARTWASVYLRMGWPVTPACAGGHEGCVTPDRHPRDVHWRRQATTSRDEYEATFRGRRSYGIIGATHRLISAVYVNVDTWSTVLAAFGRHGLHVPLARLAGPEGIGPDRLYAIVQHTTTVPPSDLLTLHPPGLPLALPAAATGGHAKWLAAPSPDATLPTVAELAAALDFPTN